MKPKPKPGKQSHPQPPPAAQPRITFTVDFADGKRLSLTAADVNKFIQTERKIYALRNSKGEVIYRKVFRG